MIQPREGDERDAIERKWQTAEMTDSGGGNPSQRAPSNEIRLLAERAGESFVTLARRGAALAMGVAIVALVVIGLAYLLGILALDGTARTVWLVLGGLLLLVGVLWPLRAALGLRQLPKALGNFVTEVQTLLSDDAEARHVVIDTVDVAPSTTASGRTVPTIVSQSQRFTSLRELARKHASLGTLNRTAQQVASVPGLAAISILLTVLGGFLVLVFGLILIF